MFGSWFVNPVGGHAQDGWEEFLPGLELAQEENLTAKHPVVIMPGITSTHLEVWNSKSVTDKVSCGLKYFRRRLWGTLNQIRAILLDKACWFEHMSLDPKTGFDPPGIKLRAAQGLDAADYLFPGYYVLARIIANLATIGYDNNNSDGEQPASVSSSERMGLLLTNLLRPKSYQFEERWETSCPQCKADVVSPYETRLMMEVSVLLDSAITTAGAGGGGGGGMQALGGAPDRVGLQELIDRRMAGVPVAFQCMYERCPLFGVSQPVGASSRPQTMDLPPLLFVYLRRARNPPNARGRGGVRVQTPG
ncbi:phospholipid:diacylglycerol acyltransferase, partial [Irineochytrium annulatum]